jgi:hypothetical protein
MDEETLTMLLRGERVNMPDRLARGLWPHPPLKFSEILTHLTKLLARNKWFPREWQTHRDGESVREGAVIECQAPDRYLYRASRSNPIQPTVLAASTERVFSNAEDAARHFLRWELHLPGDLDGWTVIE